METLKQFAAALREKLVSRVEEGNVRLANEIGANVMVGFVMSVMGAVMLVTLILNEAGVFTVNKVLVRESTVIVILISLVLNAVNQKFRGDHPWLKYVLIIGLILQCGGISALMGHNVTLVTVVPAVLTLRYFNEKFTVQASVLSAVIFLIAAYVCAYRGVVNLNIVEVDSGMTLNVSSTLRHAVENTGFDRHAYALRYLQHDYLPRFIAFSVIMTGCCMIAKRGRQMIELQDMTVKKAARIETELDLANVIQKSMLPCTLPAFPEHKNLELYAQNIPAKEVGGDFYDYFDVDDDHVAMLIADVSGKGVGAALFMMIAKTVIKNQLLLGLSPAQALTNANAQLCENNEANIFVTVWAAVYEVSTGILRFVNAGHNPPIICVRDKNGKNCRYHTTRTGFVVAAMEGVTYRESRLELHSGDELFLYTDGVTEAVNPENEQFGEQRLLDLLNSLEEETAEAQIRNVLDVVNKFTGGTDQFDDITMLGMKVH